MFYFGFMYIKLNAPRKTIKILNVIFWTLIIPLSAHFLVSIRRNDSFLELIENPYYWIALVYTLVLSYLVVFIISKLSTYWDKIEDGKNNYINRIIKQLIFGILCPFIGIIILAITYFHFCSGQVIQKSYFLKEIPIIVLYLCVLNVFYISVYLNKQIITLTKKDEEQAETPINRNKLLVHYRGDYVPIDLNEIALISQVNRINWLITFKGEKHILDLSLTAIHALLNENQFFKINRNQIVNKKIVKRYSVGSFGKLEFKLDKDTTATVSKGRAKRFKAWLLEQSRLMAWSCALYTFNLST